MVTRASSTVVFLAALVVAVASASGAQEEKSPSEKGKEASAAPADAAPHAKAEHGEAAEKHEGGEPAGGHHDDTDLSHGNASSTLTSLVDPRFDMSIYSFVVFLLLLAVLYKFAWGPIAAALEQREETILRQIEEARLASERAAQQLKEYEARLAAATDEARQIVSHARKDAEVAKDNIVAEARDAAAKERDRAVADITAAKNQALDEIANRSVKTAVALASNIIRREVRPQDHEALIGEAINEFSTLN